MVVANNNESLVNVANNIQNSHLSVTRVLTIPETPGRYLDAKHFKVANKLVYPIYLTAFVCVGGGRTFHSSIPSTDMY